MFVLASASRPEEVDKQAEVVLGIAGGVLFTGGGERTIDFHGDRYGFGRWMYENPAAVGRVGRSRGIAGPFEAIDHGGDASAGEAKTLGEACRSGSSLLQERIEATQVRSVDADAACRDLVKRVDGLLVGSKLALQLGKKGRF